MRIAYLGAGTWAFALIHLLASKGYEVRAWTRREEFAAELNKNRCHPKLPSDAKLGDNVRFTSHMEDVLADADLLVEGVTSAGFREVFEKVVSLQTPNCPVVITSKGIEQGTSNLLSEVLVELLGEECWDQIGCLSGPSHAEDVVRGLPASVSCAAYGRKALKIIQEAFSAPQFRVYPNVDVHGVELGGALKNIIAIACGISDGLGFGDSAKAALMTRGLHEIRKLAVSKGCQAETLYGLAGMGDLCTTCMSVLSRNYRFGNLLSKGLTADEAKKEIGMVVEGAYSCISALELARKVNLPLPITEGVYQIVYHGLDPKEAVKLLLQRAIKMENL